MEARVGASPKQAEPGRFKPQSQYEERHHRGEVRLLPLHARSPERTARWDRDYLPSNPAAPSRYRRR